MISSWPPKSTSVYCRAMTRMLAALHLARMGELDDAAVGAGHVALGAVVELEVRAVGIDAVQIHLILARRVVPAGEEDAAAREHGGVAIMALIEGDLIDLGAVGADHVQVEDRLGACLVLGDELRLALVDQDRLRVPLARRGEDDAAVRQIVRRDIVHGVGGRVRRQGRSSAPAYWSRSCTRRSATRGPSPDSCSQ